MTLRRFSRRAALFLCALSLPALALRSFAASPDPQAPIDPAAYPRPVSVACVGDSITFGVGTARRALDAYPAQLSRMLGARWEVGNFGNSGATLLNSGDRPYQKQGSFREALASRPDVVIIKLGTNDTKPQNWKFKDQFLADYKHLVDQFRALESKPRIFLCTPAFVPGAGNFGINEAGVQEQIALLRDFAKAENLGVIDMHAALEGQDQLLPDRVHPNTEGARRMALAAYRVLTGREFSGEMPAHAVSEWQGWKRLDFAVDNRAALLVVPKSPAPGQPWIWRTEFFGHEPQADLALLAKGWHVAYLDVQNLYGAPVALDAMDKFHAQLVREHQLSTKPVLEGFSRGGLFALNWAARNPGKVAALYLDAPVCDFKSWPGGKGKGKGSPKDWENLKKVHGFTEEQALAASQTIDNLQPLAAAKIPILSVCGDADKVVPLEENSRVLETRYKALGGTIEIIAKPGVDHHPHSLKDPTPIVEFLLKHQAANP